MKQLVTWAFDGVTKNNSPAVVGVMRASARGNWRNGTMFPWTVDQDLGSASWTWPSMPPCRQKLIYLKMFDPQLQYFKRGGHMPLMVFVGSHNQQRRTNGRLRKTGTEGRTKKMEGRTKRMEGLEPWE